MYLDIYEAHEKHIGRQQCLQMSVTTAVASEPAQGFPVQSTHPVEMNSHHRISLDSRLEFEQSGKSAGQSGDESNDALAINLMNF